MKAFTQMIQAMKFIRGEVETFTKDTYDMKAVEPHLDRIKSIIEKRQIIACEDWKAFGEELSGQTIEDHKIDKYFDEYTGSANKDETFIGRFTKGAIAHKGMVISEIYKTGNKLAGVAK